MPDGGVLPSPSPSRPPTAAPRPLRAGLPGRRLFKHHKPKSKVIILDANEEVVSKKACSPRPGKTSTRHPGVSQQQRGQDVDAATNTAILNSTSSRPTCSTSSRPSGPATSPPRGIEAHQQALGGNRLAVDGIDQHPGSPRTKRCHLPGADHAQIRPHGQPAQQTAAAAILNLLAGDAPNPAPVVMNTCYSFGTPRDAIHVASSAPSTTPRPSWSSRSGAPAAFPPRERNRTPRSPSAGRRTSGRTCRDRFGRRDDWHCRPIVIGRIRHRPRLEFAAAKTS